MSFVSTSRPGKITQLGPGAWLVGDAAAVRQVLTADDVFRPARRPEFVPGYSRSFFLATELAAEAERPRFRRALAAALSPRRLCALSARVLTPVAEALAARLPSDESLDLQDRFVRPYTRRVSYALAGVPDTTGAELVARLRVAGDLFAEDDGSPAAHALLGQVWNGVDALCRRGDLDASGLPAHAIARGLVTPDEAVLLVLPILEMAAFDMSAVLVQATIDYVATSMVRAALSPQTAASQAAGQLTSIYPTRVARRRVVVARQAVESGDRLVLDIAASNGAERCPSGAAGDEPRATDQLTFGAGVHVCLGKELSLEVAAVALSALRRHGTPQQSGDGRIRLVHEPDGRD